MRPQEFHEMVLLSKRRMPTCRPLSHDSIQLVLACTPTDLQLREQQLTPLLSFAPTPSQNEMAALPAVASAATPTPWGSYLSMILGGAAVGAGTYFGLEAQSNADIANALEIGSQRAGQDAENQALIANVLYSVGTLGLLTGIYLWFSADDVETASLSRQSQAGLRLTGLDIAPLREGALVLVGGSY